MLRSRTRCETVLCQVPLCAYRVGMCVCVRISSSTSPQDMASSYSSSYPARLLTRSYSAHGFFALDSWTLTGWISSSGDYHAHHSLRSKYPERQIEGKDGGKGNSNRRMMLGFYGSVDFIIAQAYHIISSQSSHLLCLHVCMSPPLFPSHTEREGFFYQAAIVKTYLYQPISKAQRHHPKRDKTGGFMD